MDRSVYIIGKRYRNKVFVGALLKTTSAADLTKYFSEFGKVLDANIVLDENGNSKGCGFVSFINEKQVKLVLNACPLYLNGKKLNIGPAIRKQAPKSIGEPVLVVKTSKVKSFSPNVKPKNNILETSLVFPCKCCSTVPYFVDIYGTTFFYQ
nr:protein boule-like [Hydra vulgaris]